VAAAAAIVAPDLEVIFMNVSSKRKFEGAPPASRENQDLLKSGLADCTRG
jgi:hypothetical protein